MKWTDGRTNDMQSDSINIIYINSIPSYDIKYTAVLNKSIQIGCVDDPMWVQCASMFSLVSRTVFVGSVDICLRVDQIFHHPLHCQASGQYEGRGTVKHSWIQIGGSIPQQNLEQQTV